MNEINKISVGGTVYNLQDSRITTSSVTTQTLATKFLREDGTWAAPSYTSNDGDTKNTAGTTNSTGTKLFLVGATSQAANPQTYSNANCYVGTDNCLYSNGTKVLTSYSESYTGTVTGVKVGTTSYSPSSGIISLPAYPTSLPASDVSSWAKASSKPSYAYSEISYGTSGTSATAISNSSNGLSINGTNPLQVITTTAAITSITLSTVIPDMHSCHLIITSASDSSVTLQHGATMATGYTSVHPDAGEMNLTIKAGGYVEIDLLRVGTKIYVRGL